MVMNNTEHIVKLEDLYRVAKEQKQTREAMEILDRISELSRESSHDPKLGKDFIVPKVNFLKNEQGAPCRRDCILRIPGKPVRAEGPPVKARDGV